MNIAVQINTESQETDFNFRIFSIISQFNKNHTFFFVSDKKTKDCFISSDNESLSFLSPAIKNKLTATFWYGIKLSKFLKKNKIDIFFSNNSYCSLKSHSKQVIFVNDDSFMKNTSTHKYILAASFVIIPNEYIKKLLSGKFKSIEQKLLIIKPVGDENIGPLDYFQSEEVKSVFSEGKDYFLVITEDESNEKIIKSLKAFSFFKKWQQTNMKLLIAANKKQTAFLSPQLENYKYRNDVVLINEEKANVLCTAAYGVIFLSARQQIKTHMLTAMKSCVPVIVSKTDFFQSSFNEAVLYATTDETELSQKMILLYKDETLRSELTTESYSMVSTTTFKDTAYKILQTIINP